MMRSCLNVTLSDNDRRLGRHAICEVRCTAISGALILGMALGLAAHGNADAHPRCDVARSKAYLAKKYGHVVAGGSSVSYSPDDDGLIEGQVTITPRRFVRWPKTEERPRLLVVKFRYDPDAECDWKPTFKKDVFILSRSSDLTFTIVQDFAR